MNNSKAISLNLKKANISNRIQLEVKGCEIIINMTLNNELIKKIVIVLNHSKTLLKYLPEQPASGFINSEQYTKYIEVSRKLKNYTRNEKNWKIYEREDRLKFQDEICRKFFDLTGISVEPEELFNLSDDVNDLKSKYNDIDVDRIKNALEVVFSEYTFMDIFGANNNFKNITEMIDYVIGNSDIYLCLIAVAICTNIYAAREQGCKDEIKHFKMVFSFKPVDVKQFDFNNCVIFLRRLVDIALELNDLGQIFLRDKMKIEALTFGVRRIYSGGLDQEGKLEELYNILKEEFKMVEIREK